MIAELSVLSKSISAVAGRLEELNTRLDAEVKRTKSRFNLFTVLRGAHEEAGLHSAFLAFLLNPNEAHDCDALFLKLFLECLKNGVWCHDSTSHKLETPDIAKFVAVHGFMHGC